ncbi:MAG: hypothetical protein KBF66_11000 [Rhodoferax sp.]|uniref:hypothetical protein n=1 Tax=Rhodoferax sp. TaxID=50421 RepID=UPI001B748FC3|nr:hypothetical protein [Rhodoferax sp.]MBP9906079.1 hypothetical protein [Rhodoferax sp.]
MNTNIPHFSWKTATAGHSLLSTPLDLCALDEHLGACQHPSRHWFALHCMSQSLRGFVAARLMTTLLFVAGLVLLVSWLL